MCSVYIILFVGINLNVIIVLDACIFFLLNSIEGIYYFSSL